MENSGVESILSPDHPWLLIAKIGGLAVAGVVCTYWLCALRRAREGAKRFVWNSYCSLASLYLIGVTFLLFVQTGRHAYAAPLVWIVCGIFIGGGILALRRRAPPRKRTIPKKVRDAVITRDLGRTPFDPSKHHIDHIWPFARGGSHTPDNLRVIAKKQNLKKGAKRPRLREIL
jgi:hypothetical protein